MSQTVNIRNKKASYLYEFVEQETAGMQLQGTEIKSIREGKASIMEGYCYFHKHELFVKGLTISEYKYGTHKNHPPTRERKLLMKRKELAKWEKKSAEKGVTIIPTRLFINNKGWAKLDIALAKGKKLFDKRENIKQRDADRHMKAAQKRRRLS